MQNSPGWLGSGGSALTLGLCALTCPCRAAGSYLPRINIKSQKIVSPKAGWQEGEEGKEGSSPEGSDQTQEEHKGEQTPGDDKTRRSISNMASH